MKGPRPSSLASALPVSRIASAPDLLVIAALCVLYHQSFVLTSPVNGPDELFQADGVHILGSLARQERYPFNPQNHLLYHALVDGGYKLWSGVFGHDGGSVYGFLKLFTAATALGFLLAFRALLRDLGLAARERALYLALAGVSVSAWFNFAAFETHALVLPPLTLSLLALQRLGVSPLQPRRVHLLLVASLVACGLARTEAWRFTAIVAVLPLVPRYRRCAGPLLRDVVVAAVLGAALTFCLAKVYLGVPWVETLAKVSERRDAPLSAHLFGRLDNLRGEHLVNVARAASIYAFAMPVRPQGSGEAGEPGPGPRKRRKLKDRYFPYFSTPLASMRGDPLALAMLAALLGMLLSILRPLYLQLRSLDPFPIAVTLSWLSSWLFFTWWNPYEPFLWTLDFLPLTVALAAGALSAGRRWQQWLPACTALLLFVHNVRFFYLAFR